MKELIYKDVTAVLWMMKHHGIRFQWEVFSNENQNLLDDDDCPMKWQEVEYKDIIFVLKGLIYEKDIFVRESVCQVFANAT